MSVHAEGMIARTGLLAARFAQRTAKRVTARRPGMEAGEVRLAARRGIARAMPPLTVSLTRLLAGTPPAQARPGGAAPRREAAFGPGLTPMMGLRQGSRAPLFRQPGDGPRPESEDRHSKRGSVPMLPPRAPFLSAPSGLARRREEAFLPRRVEEGPTMPPGKFAPAPPAREPALRQMPPTVLRQTLVRQGGAGEMLASRLRDKLRPHLKFDPALARLHRGAAAAGAARTLNAEAFTIGPDVFFGEGRYAPQTRTGLGLLAHELTHVGQQAALIGDKMRFFTPQGGDAMESEAQRTAAETLDADDREKVNRTGGALHQASAPPRPALAFALSSARSRGGSASVPAQKATEESGQSNAKAMPAQSDARAVSDRVYELMKQEIALGRERGSSRRKG